MKNDIYARMRKNGLSDYQMLQAKAIAAQATKAIEKKYSMKSFLYMLSIPLNVLVADGKITKENVGDYMKDVMSLYESLDKGVVTDKMLADFLEEYAGIKLDVDWEEL